VETRLSLALSANRLQLQKFVEVTSTNAAKLYGLYPRKGALIPGESDADLTIWYPNGMEPFVLTNSLLHHNVDYTPYEGRTMKQWPRYTVLRGEVVWAKDEGGLVGRKGYGQFLKRDVSSMAGGRSDAEWDVQNF
jgi:dihydropyrimidinase